MNGPGLKVISSEIWYGPGYCGVCGDTGPNLVPQAVRFWCPDDGWKVGVLCGPCCKNVRHRGPEPSDYAYKDGDRSDRIDAESNVQDSDALYSDHSGVA